MHCMRTVQYIGYCTYGPGLRSKRGAAGRRGMEPRMACSLGYLRVSVLRKSYLTA
jgi:hypothetical protein